MASDSKWIKREDAGELPPLPEPGMTNFNYDGAQRWYTATQMREYARAALAAQASGQDREDAAMYRWLCDTAISVQSYTSGPPNWLFRPMELRGMTCDAAIKAARAAAKGE